jgi:16S rRNA processing protein RimM
VINASDWVILGRLGRPQGLKGLIRVISFTQPRSAILDYMPLHIQIKDTWHPLAIDTFQIQNETILVKLSSYSERETVAELTNCYVGIPPAQLPQLPEGEYYWHELKQMTVINQEGILLGEIIDILPTGSNDVLVVKGEKRHLIPYVPGVHIMSVDPVKRQIVADWDENF